MEFANDSLAYRKRFTTMTDQPNAPAKEKFPVIRKIGRFMTGMLYLEMGIYLLLGLVALLMGGVTWLIDVFK
jgi:hypothetical protein